MERRTPNRSLLAVVGLLALLRPVGPQPVSEQIVDALPAEGALAVCLDHEERAPASLRARPPAPPVRAAPPPLRDAPTDDAIVCTLDAAWHADRWAESVGHLTAVWPVGHGSTFVAVSLDGPTVTLAPPAGALGPPVLQSADLLDLPVVVGADGRCALPPPTPRAHLSGAVVGIDGGRVTVTGCGGWTTAHPDGSWFLRVDPGACTLTAHQVDADGRRWSDAVDLDLAPGDDRLVDLALRLEGDSGDLPEEDTGR